MVTFKIGAVPGEIREFTAQDGTSITAAIETAEIFMDNMEVRVNGEVVSDLSRPVVAGTTVLVSSGRVKGN
jgi:hypothetical protein